MTYEDGKYERAHGTTELCESLTLGKKHKGCTWPGYDVRGMILLRDLQGGMRLDYSKDMSVRVSTCTSYDFNA
jgi:hypothetical protein